MWELRQNCTWKLVSGNPDFGQLYVLSVKFTDPMDHRAFMYPVVYVLLKKKTKAAYRQMFNALNSLDRWYSDEYDPYTLHIIHLLIIPACYANWHSAFEQMSIESAQISAFVRHQNFAYIDILIYWCHTSSIKFLHDSTHVKIILFWLSKNI